MVKSGMTIEALEAMDHENSTLVVLLMPELLGPTPDFPALARSFATAAGPVRALVVLRQVCPPALMNWLQSHQIARQLLVQYDVPVPDTADRVAKMPPGSTMTQLYDLALAWSDFVMVAPDLSNDNETKALLNHAERLHKHVCPPGCTRIQLTVRPSVARGLDPEHPGRLGVFVGRAGRLEQFWLEVFARGWPCDEDRRERERRLWKEHLTQRLTLKAHFAPLGWEGALSDMAARDQSAPIVAAFERLDRSALFGAHLHRDMLWFVYGCAAIAVFVAVLGGLLESGHKATGIIELVALLLVGGPIFTARRLQLQERWTASRLAAEQLRVARLCLPLMILPPALSSSEQLPHEHGMAAQFTFDALSEVRRAVRDQGVPSRAPDSSLRSAIGWLKLMVLDQIGYHRDNHRKLEHAEHRLTFLTQFVYFASFTAVCVELVAELHWLLLITAAGPALAAALHGVSGRLSIVNRVELSRETEGNLLKIDRDIDALAADAAADCATGWTRLRALAFEAADIMGRETRNWHGLLRRSKEIVP